MKRPAFQFYPDAWLSNLKLRLCTKPARACWIDTLCVLHGSDEYGVVRFPLRDLAEAAHAPIALLRELAGKGVLKGSDGRHEAYVFIPRHGGKEGKPVTLVDAGSGPCWYSSRMVRDEYIRSKRGFGTRFGDTPNDEPMPIIGSEKSPPKGGIGAGPLSLTLPLSTSVENPTITAGATPTAKPNGDKSPAKTKPGNGWQKSREGQLAMGEYLGLPPRRGEVETEYRARLFDALNAQQANH